MLSKEFTTQDGFRLLQESIYLYNKHQPMSIGFVNKPVEKKEYIDKDLLETMAFYGKGFVASKNIKDSLISLFDCIFEQVQGYKGKKTFIPRNYALCTSVNSNEMQLVVNLFGAMPFCVDISISDGYIGYRFKLYELE